MISLTTRLTLLFILVSVAIFTALGLLIQHSIGQHFETQDYSELDDKLRVTANIVKNLQSHNALPAVESVIKNSVVDHDSIIIKIVSSSGDSLFSASAIALPYETDTLLREPGRPQRLEWHKGDVEYRGVAMALPEDQRNGQQLIISAAMETTRHTMFMHQFARKLLGLMLVATMLSALLGWWVSRQGLSPLRAMGSKAKSVTAKHLDQRLPVDAVPVELAALAIELNSMLDRLEESFNRITHFSSDIAHELRTPISNLVTQTQVSLSQQRSVEDYRDILASNLEELDRLSRMISDMLFLAKAENNIELPSSERFMLEFEIVKLFDFYEALAEEHNLTLCMQGSGELKGDRIMVDRAISNLLSNAIRHTPDGGSIDVDIEPKPGELLVHIRNTGEAIPAKELPYLFDRFYRCDQARCHTAHEGTGLGLSITQAIVKAHGGHIDVHSDLDKTCFTLVFPA
ncbi:heavy metal sensor histidine kinase [Marinobacterium sp. D7]|uniref:heavy metal sensor histidine kinase n=1 Tax=Marinobacterium ramblicola TaxID=2849041 RepID=UPI001C2D0D9D|nr:heavy metal sensor histidine kinase [Marinobacterium ramblicola]MBV1788077.1 heavy metal sensor histidine kinase [Marinobacterium ramblicola]